MCCTAPPWQQLLPVISVHVSVCAIVGRCSVLCLSPPHRRLSAVSGSKQKQPPLLLQQANHRPVCSRRPPPRVMQMTRSLSSKATWALLQHSSNSRAAWQQQQQGQVPGQQQQQQQGLTTQMSMKGRGSGGSRCLAMKPLQHAHASGGKLMLWGAARRLEVQHTKGEQGWV